MYYIYIMYMYLRRVAIGSLFLSQHQITETEMLKALFISISSETGCHTCEKYANMLLTQLAS